MTKEDFKKYIEHPIDKLKIADTESCEEAERMFWRRLEFVCNNRQNAEVVLEIPRFSTRVFR